MKSDLCALSELNDIFKYADLAYPGVRDNRSTLNTKTGYDDDE